MGWGRRSLSCAPLFEIVPVFTWGSHRRPGLRSKAAAVAAAAVGRRIDPEGHSCTASSGGWQSLASGSSELLVAGTGCEDPVHSCLDRKDHLQS